MKVLSLLQPWATLVVIGAKHIETRSWKTQYRGPLLIHASKKLTPEQKILCDNEPFKTALRRFKDLPLGAIIGKVNLTHIITTEQVSRIYPITSKGNPNGWEREQHFGDYSPGRYGWILREQVHFSHYVPVNGSLSIWDFEERICAGCGCTQEDCRHCIEKTGQPCSWVSPNLCSACKQ